MIANSFLCLNLTFHKSNSSTGHVANVHGSILANVVYHLTTTWRKKQFYSILYRI